MTLNRTYTFWKRSRKDIIFVTPVEIGSSKVQESAFYIINNRGKSQIPYPEYIRILSLTL